MTPEERPDPCVEVLRRLRIAATFKRPRAAIAAYRSLVALGAFEDIRRGPWQRLSELAMDSRPSVAAAAVRALVWASRAKRRSRRL